MNRFLKIVIFMLFGTILFTGCSVGGNDTSKYNINIDSDKNIDTKAYVSADKSQMIIYMTNNYEYNIGSIEVEVVYYDKDGNKIDEDSTSLLNVEKGIEVVASADLPKDSEYNNYVPEKTEIKVTIDEEYQTVTDDINMFNTKVSSTYKKNGKNVDVTLTNNAGVDLVEVEFAIVYMKHNKLVYVDSERVQLNKGANEKISMEIPVDWSKSEDDDVLIDFDSAKILILRASDEW